MMFLGPVIPCSVQEVILPSALVLCGGRDRFGSAIGKVSALKFYLTHENALHCIIDP